MNDAQLRREISITLQFKDWCLVLGVLNSVIENSVTYVDPQISQQTHNLARIREVIDKATD